MPKPYEKLRDAYQQEKNVTVTETDGTVHEQCVVTDFTRIRTATFEIWRFTVQNSSGEETRLFWTDLETVDVLGDASDGKG